MKRSILAALFLPTLTTIALGAPQWIWLSKTAKNDEKVTLKTEFQLDGPVKSALLSVAVDNGAKATVNGKPALENPDWNEVTRADIAKLLATGKNELRLDARNEGNIAGAVVLLSIEYADGRKTKVESGPDWLAAPTGGNDFKPAAIVANYGDGPWGRVLAGVGGAGGGRSSAPGNVIAADKLELPKGFKAELLYNVPKAEQGSWVSMAVDPKGRLITCDQNGGLYRVSVSMDPAATKVEALAPVPGEGGRPIGGAHGLLYAFDSLYVMVNETGGKGLWRLRDTNGDDQFDQAQHLRRIEGGGEHGPHSVIPGPDGKSLWFCSGNHTRLPDKYELSRGVAWQEDYLTPRLWDSNGHARGILAPGGYICKTDPDAKTVEVHSIGFRNEFDIAFDANGELFTYDSDMEWDIGAPWYRPTRIAHCTSGSDNGWRSAAGKWPNAYPDGLPPIVDMGPGSPTGIVMGTGAKFPAKYQRALFALDWTYGTMWAVHFTPEGASFRAEKEEFVGGKPLPLTDAVIRPQDGAMYFTVGGRKTQSGLYRVTYTGTESTGPAAPYAITPESKLRHEIEKLHEKGTSVEAIDKAWPYLSHKDRWIRFAARVAIERQPITAWASRALAEKNPQAAVEALIALSRVGRSPAAAAAALAAQQKPGYASGPVHETQSDDDVKLQILVLDALDRFDFGSLTPDLRIPMMRAYGLALARFGKPAPGICKKLAARFDAFFPGKDALENRELVQLLTFVDSPTIVGKVVPLLATTQDASESLASDSVLNRNDGYAKAAREMTASRPNRQAFAYAYHLRNAVAGWTPSLRRAYFAWFPSTRAWKGGNSFKGFIENIRKDSLANVPESEREIYDKLSAASAPTVAAATVMPKGPGRAYTVDDIAKIAGGPLTGRNFANGKSMFAATLCAACHHFAGEGGNIGPDLTGVGNRYTIRDLAENIVDPSKVISDQYDSHELTMKDGSVVIGRVIGENGGNLMVMASPLTPTELTLVPAANVKSRKPFAISMMPPGLINTLNEEELKDLIAYMQSGGNENDKAFKK